MQPPTIKFFPFFLGFFLYRGFAAIKSPAVCIRIALGFVDKFLLCAVVFKNKVRILFKIVFGKLSVYTTFRHFFRNFVTLHYALFAYVFISRNAYDIIANYICFTLKKLRCVKYNEFLSLLTSFSVFSRKRESTNGWISLPRTAVFLLLQMPFEQASFGQDFCSAK